MKKIIWIFGEAGSGKKTLVKKIINNEDNVRDLLHIVGDRIIVYDDPTNDNRQSTWETHASKKERIEREVTSFMQNDDDILLLVGDHNDIESIHNNSLITLATKYPNIEKEIIYVESSDLNVQYERLLEEEWFQNDFERNRERFPKIWLEISTRHLKKSLREYAEYGYNLTEIDTKDGYDIQNSVRKAK